MKSKDRLRFLFGVLIAFAALAAWAGQTHADEGTNREIIRVYANTYLDAKDFDNARKVLGKHLKEDPKDAGAWNLMGLVLLKQTENEPAEKAFYNAIQLVADDDQGIYLYNHADALTRRGKLDQAQESLKRAQGYALIKTSATQALIQMRAGEPLPSLDLRPPPPSPWKLYFSAGTGYDSNVTLASSTATSSGGLSTATATSTASLNSTALGQVSTYTDLWEQTFSAMMVSAFSYYFSSSAQRYNSLYNMLDLLWGSEPDAKNPDAWSVGNRMDVIFLNSSGFQFYNFNDFLYGVMKWKHRGGSRSQLQGGGGYRLFGSSASAGDNNRSGVFFRGAGEHEWSWGDWTLNAGADYEFHLAGGKNYVAHTFAAPLSVSRPLFWEISGRWGVQPSYVIYPSNTQARKDFNLRGTFAVTHALFWKIGATLQYGFQGNFSNLTSASYDKHLVTLVLNYEAL